MLPDLCLPRCPRCSFRLREIKNNPQKTLRDFGWCWYQPDTTKWYERGVLTSKIIPGMPSPQQVLPPQAALHPVRPSHALQKLPRAQSPVWVFAPKMHHQLGDPTHDTKTATFASTKFQSLFGWQHGRARPQHQKHCVYQYEYQSWWIESFDPQLTKSTNMWVLIFFLHILNGRMATLPQALPRSFRPAFLLPREQVQNSSFRELPRSRCLKDFSRSASAVTRGASAKALSRGCVEVCYLYLLVGRAFWQWFWLYWLETLKLKVINTFRFRNSQMANTCLPRLMQNNYIV